jgi:hypothetical protein
MSEPTLQDIFGASATQTASSITIQKADLTGLNPSPTNGAEQIFAALISRSQAALTATNQAANPEQNITVVAGFDSITYRTVAGISKQFYQRVYNVNLQSPNNPTPIDPNAY